MADGMRQGDVSGMGDTSQVLRQEGIEKYIFDMIKKKKRMERMLDDLEQSPLTKSAKEMLEAAKGDDKDEGDDAESDDTNGVTMEVIKKHLTLMTRKLTAMESKLHTMSQVVDNKMKENRIEDSVIG
ncbi:hypothetical protein HDE_03646 [Halotydeus destructor]|nr:hypothetical protein HDE_03646 [Halotydeus destructor]